MSKRWQKRAAHVIIRAGLLSATERLEARLRNVLRILAYHRVGQPEAETGRLHPDLLSASPDMFARQMHFLSAHYHVVSLDELLYSLAYNRPLPPRSVMVTFDDGYRDFLDTAWPVLQSLRVPAILFVVTGYLSGGGRLFWWDQLYQAVSQTKCEELRIPSVGVWSLRGPEQRRKAVAEIERYVKKINHHQAMSLVTEILESLAVLPKAEGTMLTWQDVRHLSASGLYIGAHTRSHPILSRVTLEEARNEIISSQQDLYRELGQTWPVFAYPVGRSPDLRPELASILHEEGFQAAVTLIPGHNLLGHTHPLRFKRVNIASTFSMAEFRLALTGVYHIYETLLRLRPVSV